MFRFTSLLRIVSVGCLALSVACASTHQAVNTLEFNNLTEQVKRCQDAIALLKGTPDPEVGSDAAVFVPTATLNDVLKEAEKIQAPIAGINATLEIDAISVNSSCGSPVVNLTASAHRGSLSVAMESAIVLDLSVDPKQPTIASVTLLLTDIKPVAKWGPFQFALRGFVKDLLQVKLADYAKTLPALTIPLVTQVPFSIPNVSAPISFPVPSGIIYGTLRTPGLQGTLALTITRILFLGDGLHAYFQASF